MRSVLLLATTALAAATPALAAPRSAEEAEAARLADRLNDPAAQSAMSAMMIAMADAMMSLRVDGLDDAMRRIDPDAGDSFGGARTLGEAVERDDPDFRRDLAEDSRRGAATMGAMASGVAQMLPELRRMGERMARDIDRAMRHLPR